MMRDLKLRVSSIAIDAPPYVGSILEAHFIALDSD